MEKNQQRRKHFYLNQSKKFGLGNTMHHPVTVGRWQPLSLHTGALENIPAACKCSHRPVCSHLLIPKLSRRRKNLPVHGNKFQKQFQEQSSLGLIMNGL